MKCIDRLTHRVLKVAKVYLLDGQLIKVEAWDCSGGDNPLPANVVEDELDTAITAKG